jgi:hypothetical protein
MQHGKERRHQYLRDHQSQHDCVTGLETADRPGATPTGPMQEATMAGSVPSRPLLDSRGTSLHVPAFLCLSAAGGKA